MEFKARKKQAMNWKPVLLMLFVTPLSLPAQEGFGTWNVLNFKGEVAERWSVFAEAQIRSYHFYDHFFYYEFKGGVSRSLGKNFSIAALAGRYVAYQEGGDFVKPIAGEEFRTTAQLQMLQYLGRVDFEHRYRVEQRWTNTGYKNRFRYRFLIQTPINGKIIEPGVFYATVWNELFFTDKAPFFARDRFFLGGGYEFSPSFGLTAGWVYQFDYKIGDSVGRDFLQLTLLYKWKRKGDHDSWHPSPD